MPKSSPLSREEKLALRERWLADKCQHCGGLHLRACPRVRRMAFRDGALVEVEFWDTWNTDDVAWPEDFMDVEAD